MIAKHGVRLAVGGVFDGVGLAVEGGFFGFVGGGGLALQGVGLALAGRVYGVGLLVRGVFGGAAAGDEALR